MKERRTVYDKLNTLLFGKDLRITKGDVYTEEREGDYTSYYPIENYISDQDIPEENAYYITDFGALANDKSVDNSAAINSCINKCSENGGGYVVVSGGDFTTKTVEMKSNVTLHIASGSSIVAEESGLGFSHMALVYAKDCENISITGGGTINGNGHLFGLKPLLDENVMKPDEVIDVIKMRRVYRAQLRFAHPTKYGRLVELSNCRNIKVNNIVFKDSAYWTFRMTKCVGADIQNLVINDNRNVGNTDGIDIMQCCDVNIKHCFISCADDGIVLKNAIWEGCDGEMENINISDCEIISRTNAFKIGTETTFPISNIRLENCRFLMTDLYPGSVSGISIESADGSVVSNIEIRNVEMQRCTCPIFIRLCNRNRAALVDNISASAIEFGKKVKGQGTDKNRFNNKGEVYNVLIENVKAEDVELPVIIAGYKEKGVIKRVKGITLNNISLEYRNVKEVYDKRLFIPEYAKEYPECWRFRNLPAYAIWARHAENIIISNFSCKPARSTWKEEYIFEDVI